MFNKTREKSISTIIQSKHRMRDDERFMRFLDIYIDCEAIAVKLIEYYKKDKKKQQNQTIILRVDTLIKAMHHFNLSFSNQTIYKIFSSYKYKNDIFTARQLRNAYVHGRKQIKANALLQQYQQLTKDMEDFIKAILPLIT